MVWEQNCRQKLEAKHVSITMDETFPSGTYAIISPRTPPQGRAWGRGGGHRAGAGASHATCRWPKTRSGGRDIPTGGTYRSRGQGQATPPAAGQKPVQEDGTYRSRLGWAETCNTLNKFRKINQTPDWPHFSCIKFFKTKSLYIHAFHYITETFNTA